MLESVFARQFIRKIAWIASKVFWQHLLPSVSGVISKETKNSIAVKVSSPFLTGRLLRLETVDGAVISSAVATTSWAKYALPKGLPVQGNRTLAIENDPHFVDDFDGVIESGYGKGIKTLLLSDNAIVKIAGKTSVQKVNYHIHEADRAGTHYDLVVTGVNPGTKQWELNIPRGQYKGRYAFVTTPNGMIVTPMKDHGVIIPKPDYTLRKDEVLTAVDPNTVIIERKIDGSLGNAHVQGQRVSFRSHREGGETYYDKLPAIEFLTNVSPYAVSRLLYKGPSLTGTVFQGELVHPEGAARVSGILNSLATNARDIQQRRGPVRYYVWDIIKYKGRDVSGKNYAERRALCDTLVEEIRLVNKNWDIVERADMESPKDFYARITSDPLPYGEGIVIKPKNLAVQKWDKIKMTGFGYFKLVDILPGEGKYAKSVGRLVVENRENGARGEVGSLSVPDEFRDWVWKNRKFLIGETVKVRSQAITERGVPRAGVFYGFHNGEVDLLMAAEANAAGTGKTPEQVMYAMKSAQGWRRTT